MSVRKLLIATPVDRLILIVKKRKKISLSEAARYLGVSQDQVEEWVRVLEEQNYVKLIYPPVGSPKILLGEIPEEQLEVKEEEFGEKAENVQEKAKRMEILAKKKEIKTETLNRLEKERRRVLQNIKEMEDIIGKT